MEKFYKKIKADNRHNRIWLVMWFVAVCSIILELHDDKKVELIMSVTLLALSSYEYFMKYFFLYQEGRFQIERFKFLFFFNSISYSNLTDIFRQHAFSLREYMKILVYKFIPVQVVTALIAIGYEVLYHVDGSKQIHIYSLIKIWSIIVVPFVVANAFYFVKYRELTRDISATKKFVWDLIDKTFQGIKLVLTVIFAVRIVLVGYYVVISRLILSIGTDSKWRLAVVHTDGFLVAMICLVAILGFLVVSRYRTSTSRVFIGLITLAMCVVVVIFLYKKNIVINDEKIKVTMNFKSVEYEYDDIDYYKSYVEKEESGDKRYVYMLYMKNGKMIKVDFENVMTEDSIERNGQMTDESNKNIVRKSFLETLKKNNIVKR